MKLGDDSFPSSRRDGEKKELRVPVGTELCPGFAAWGARSSPPRTSQNCSCRRHRSLPSRRILAQDGVADAVRRSRYYEKPSRARRRRAFEACRRVYCAEMARRIAFLARSSRQDPWLGC
ncbi:28S ribosomal protein S21, mitochondrial isoform X1 [Cyanistes caeruleus]|uniref:28S ribosomal protein S21, mitochondrial isoform X1 n=1 Tax=Cyanistes caeruleus TaxID=156563 RepID=UPI000CDB12EF|nr:28S ribosomal protein S21, mitochondrial isoform X1 [Cyanistes caeruleus]